MVTIELPAPTVFAAFGAGFETPQRMSGGQGLTWRAGDVVVRPSDDPHESVWKSGVLAELEGGASFRTARPIPTTTGHFVYEGWEAWQWIEGEADESRVVDVIRAGEAFHNAVSLLRCPAFIERKDNAWSRADRMAWGECPMPSNTLLDRLGAEFRPVRLPSQVIHGDLLGNVLFAQGLPPAIIDWAPYWRPAAYGAAIAAADAVCWHGWPLDRIGELGVGIPEWRQLLVRALAFRIATLHNLDSWDAASTERHAPVVAAVFELRP